MEADFGPPARGRDDPLYDEGLAHVQAGEWPAALRCFETLAERYPGDVDVVRNLDQTRFRARLDKETHVKPKGITIRWSRVFRRVLLVVALAALTYVVFWLITEQIAPAIQKQRERAAFLALVQNCRDMAEGIDFAGARTACQAVLQEDPNNKDAAALLLVIDKKAQEKQDCDEAEALLNTGDDQAALDAFTRIQLKSPGACKAVERIQVLKDRLDVAGVLKQCHAAAEADNYEQVTNYCEQVRARNTTLEAEAIGGYLHKAYLALGKAMVEQKPPQLERLPLALDDFTKALSFAPNDTVAQAEQRLASQYLAGQQAIESGRLDDAIARLAPVVASRPAYLDGLAVQRLYDTYLRRGDQYRDAGDPSLAYHNYDLAARLPDVDPASAINRRDSVAGLLTPTPTPTNTPTITPIPTATPYVPPAPTPLPTPAPPLSTLRGKIVFFSAKPEQEGLWVMNPDGSQKRYLGPVTAKLQKEYDELRQKETYSPDGRFHVYALKANGDVTVQVYYQGRDRDGYLVTQRVTNGSKISYDPVWAPDGSRIAFVSPEQGSDDIWVIYPDGTDAWNYTQTKNPWEWDKWPSWSPDSRQITFWSNREGTKQIYVIDADGRSMKKISGDAPWDEYNPLWIK